MLKAVKKAVRRDADLPRLPKRQGPNKANQTVDGLLVLYAIIDEKKLNDELPLYAAADLFHIPFLNAESVNITNVAQKLELFEQRLLAVQQHTPSSQSVAVPDWSSSMPNDGNNTDEAAHEDVTVEQDVNAGAWNVVTRRHRPLTARNSQTIPAQKPVKTVQQKRNKLVGTARISEQTLKSGVDIVRKSVIHVDNLNINCMHELLKDYLLSKDVAVSSCYAMKSWLRNDEKEMLQLFMYVLLPNIVILL